MGETMTFFDESEWRGCAYIGGWSPVEETRPVVNPATGEQIAEVGSGTPADLDDAVGRASAAQREWAAKPAEQRAAVLRRAAVVLEENFDTIADWLVREAGSGRGKAEFEVGVVASEAHAAAATAMMPYGQQIGRAHV